MVSVGVQCEAGMPTIQNREAWDSRFNDGGCGEANLGQPPEADWLGRSPCGVHAVAAWARVRGLVSARALVLGSPTQAKTRLEWATASSAVPTLAQTTREG